MSTRSGTRPDGREPDRAGGPRSPREHAIGLIMLGLALAGSAWVAIAANSYYVFLIATMALTIIVGIGLNVLLGLTGQMSFGHVGFYAIGAYVVAILTTTAKLSFWIALPLATLLAGLVGALLALPALRVRGPYLAMVTIAFGFVVEHSIIEWAGLTGGQNGIMGITPPSAFGVAFGERGVALLALGLTAVCLYGYWRLDVSTWGTAMRAVRDAEVAAESIGLNPPVVKTLAFAISAACAGLAGGLFAPLAGFVTPSTFSFLQSILFVLVVIVGGAATLSGPIVGAALVVFLPEVLAGLAEYRLLFFGALLLIVLWIAPSGIVGTIQARLHHARGQAGEPTVDGGSGATTLVRPPALMPMDVAGLGIAFGGVKAATDVSFQAHAGAITSIIGPNGAGKTTVLNMLSGFYRPDAGTIRLGAQAVQGRRAWAIARSGLARTYQTSQLFGSLSVRDNLLIATRRGRLGRGPLGRIGGTRDHDAQRTAALLDFVDYRGHTARPAADLPHVDRRLVEIARALATGASVLLLDEPAAGLSREDKHKLARTLRRIADAGYTVILVEHDMSIVMSISDQVVVLDAGLCIASGPPHAVQNDPTVREAYLGEDSTRIAAAFRGTDAIAPALLQTSALTTGYGAEPVLHDISVEVRRGESVAVLGANGAGKSTLMRSIAGLHRPVAGQVRLEQAELAAMSAHRVAACGVVLVPEGRQVFPELSVLDNIRLGGFRHRDSNAQELDAVLARFPRLRERLHQRAGLLSGGEQQMLAVARGLMGRPRVLLLDEPSLGLAPKVIEDLFAALEQLRTEQVTILLVDQMARLALALADRAYVIEGGRIVAGGSAAEIAGDPRLAQAYLGESRESR